MTEEKRINLNNRHSSLSRSQAALVRSHARVVARLPLCVFHTSRFVRDSDDLTLSEPYVERPPNLMYFRKCGVVEKVDKLECNGTLFHLWSALEPAVKQAREYLDSLETPVPGCPHAGIRNVPDGGYTCCTDDCDNEVPREVVEYGQ